MKRSCSFGWPNNKSLESVDRISGLPDSILGIILSFLPTKNAVSTALLSKRWKLVWTTLHNLDLCYEDSLGKQDLRDDMRFVGFVNRVLLHHDAGRLNRFRLVWTPRCISSHATSWITTAISKNVHELSLRLETHTLLMYDGIFYRTDTETFVMPKCVLCCNTLRYLELDCGISIDEPIVVCLPTLETIKLSVSFGSEEAFEKLIRGCPVLINLLMTMPDDRLFEFPQDADFKYIISSTSLRRLEICKEYEADEPLYINLELEASSLEYLTLVGVGLIPVFCVQESLSSLVEAKFDVYLGEFNFSNAICNSVVRAVRVLDCAKSLILTSSIIWALSCATISLSTEFKRLVKLETETYCCGCSSLRDLIQCSDNLEVLTIHQYLVDEEDEEDHDNSNWTTPVEVPRCLSTSLKKVVLDGYYGNEDEHEMICYLLEHGSALEVMQIFCDNSVVDEQYGFLVQETRGCPKKSPACEVTIFRLA